MGSAISTKSYTKRFRVTKTGKLKRRTQGQSHARADKSQQLIRRRRGIMSVSRCDRKIIANKLGVK